MSIGGEKGAIEDSNQNFLNVFKTSQYPEYFDPVPFNKGFGFSIKRKYDPRIRRLLPELQDEDFDYLALFHIYIEDEELANTNHQKILGIRVGMVVGKKKLMLPDNPKINWPVDMVSDDFCVDLEQKKFSIKGREIEPMHMLEQIYNTHVKPCKTVKGFWFRTKKRLLLFHAMCFVAISQTLVLIAKILFNDKYTWNHSRRALETEYPKLFEKKDVEKTEPPKEDFFGFKASRWSLFMYCLFHLIGFFIFRNKDPIFIKQIITNPFLSVTYAFFSLCLFEKYLPLLFGLLIRKTTVYAYRIKETPLQV